MRHAENQCLRACAVQPASKPSHRLHQHHMHVLPVKTNVLEDTEGSTTNWETLWIDVGGEG